MLPRKYRLTADKDISKVFKKGRPAGAGAFGIRYAPNGKMVARFAFVVGTKVSKKAVVRNRLKRQLREIVHAEIAAFRPGVDVVIMARKEALDVTFAEMKKTVIGGFRRAGLLDGKKAV